MYVGNEVIDLPKHNEPSEGAQMGAKYTFSYVGSEGKSTRTHGDAHGDFSVSKF